jgi:hypothetical protein
VKANGFWDHAIIGSQWLLEQQNPDGSWNGLNHPMVDAFYKGGWALAATGQLPAAQRSLSYAKSHFMMDDGDFLPRGHPWHIKVHYLYANAYFIVGSMICARYDIARPAVSFMLTQQDPDHGGFYTRRVKAGQKEISDTMSTGAAGIACLAAGDMDAAKRAADYFSRIVELQPASGERFYTTLEVDGRLGTEMQTEDEAFWRMIDTKIDDQCWYAVGLPFAFLIQMAEATGQSRYLELAYWYFAFQEKCVNPWDGGSSGKAGWANAMLYRITGNQRYRDIAFHVADMIVSKQNPKGSWISSGPGNNEGEEQELTNASFDLNAEYTLWLALISSNILARDAG